MNEQKELIQELLLTNEKLSAIVQLYDRYYLTKEEKEEAQTKINKAQNSDEINTAVLSLSKAFNSSYQFSDNDTRWSPGFIRELLKYYENQTGFNPVERLKNPFAIVKSFFELKAHEDKLDEVDAATFKQISEALPNAMKAIQEIFKDLEQQDDTDYDEPEETIETQE